MWIYRDLAGGRAAGGRARLAPVPEDDALQAQQLEQAQEGLEAVAAAGRAHQHVVRARRHQVQQEVAACVTDPGPRPSVG
jgi:hypothetical protein